jgi:hypothetical protein
MLESISNVLSMGTMTRRPEDRHIEIRGNAAWWYYRVTGEFHTNGKSIPLALIESLILERIGGKWRIVQGCTMSSATRDFS